MILCGWCGQATVPARCMVCGRDPRTPWLQRAQEPPTVDEGRPALDPAEVRRLYAEAKAALGPAATVEALAERLGRSPRTIRDWRRRFGLR